MTRKNLLLNLIILILISSCAVYNPQPVDIPLIQKKNDLRIDAGLSFNPIAHATVSYGLTKIMALQVSGNVGTKQQYYLQAATGLYHNFNNNKVIELYGGYGLGYGHSYYDEVPGSTYGDYQLYFGQINFGKLAKSSAVELGFGLKAGYFLSQITDENDYKWNRADDPIPYYDDKSLLFEPMGVIKLGDKKLRFSINIGSSIIYKLTDSNYNIPHSKLNIGFGLNYRL